MVGKFLIVTHALHKESEAKYYAYSPYVREMNLWISNAAEVTIVAPFTEDSVDSAIEMAYLHTNISFVRLKTLNFSSLRHALSSVFLFPSVFFSIVRTMRSADHIHLRCPGNIGLLGAVAQIFFPEKSKTAKYAGNWSDYRNQPFSYYFQKRVLSNTTLSRNMNVLAYCSGPQRSRNVVPFFTASYSGLQADEWRARNLNSTIEFMFVGTLTSNKNPLAAVALLHRLMRERRVLLHMVGEGPCRKEIMEYSNSLGIAGSVILHGNLTMEPIIGMYKRAHFLILLSDSEGWPKAVAEAMFWGCVPIASKVSCVPWMLETGARGILADKNDLESAGREVESVLGDPDRYWRISEAAAKWSRQFTLERFEKDVSAYMTDSR